LARGFKTLKEALGKLKGEAVKPPRFPPLLRRTKKRWWASREVEDFNTSLHLRDGKNVII
jgi:hypothetical protein